MVEVSRESNVNVALTKTLSETVTVSDNNCQIRMDATEITTVQEDFIDCLEDFLIEQLWLIRNIETEDAAGRNDDYVETKICAPGRIMPLSEKDRNIESIGTIISGDMIGYFKPTYTNFSTDYEVEEGDQIERESGVKFRVEKILHRQAIGDSVVYIKAYLRRLE